jgi:hypothetical protein
MEAPKKGMWTAIGWTKFSRMVEWWQGGRNVYLDTPIIYLFLIFRFGCSKILV